nr:MAG TPA: hypothetical protein [Caudoviricetes sp.]
MDCYLLPLVWGNGEQDNLPQPQVLKVICY